MTERFAYSADVDPNGKCLDDVPQLYGNHFHPALRTMQEYAKRLQQQLKDGGLVSERLPESSRATPVITIRSTEGQRLIGNLMPIADESDSGNSGLVRTRASVSMAGGSSRLLPRVLGLNK